MKPTRLVVESFKRVAHVELNLADVTILVGSNSSGKSSVLQATHLACCVMRQADKIHRTDTSPVRVEELDYLPTESYKELGHRSTWGNNKHTPSSKVRLEFADDSGASHTAACELRSARNAGISITGSIDQALSPLLRNSNAFFSAYIPGISGIPNREEKKGEKVAQKACSYGDSNIILRNVLHLLKERDPQNLTLLENWLSELMGNIKLSVDYDDSRDLVIKCTVEIMGDKRPLELVGTGFLQLIQIFSYILLFSPGILLIDEPDTHLHPSVQEKLPAALERVARERGTRIILSTHSPFIIRGASYDSTVYWINDGKVESTNREQVQLALGWGAFGKRALLLTEDANNQWLKAILAQWPQHEAMISILPGIGYKTLPSPAQARDLSRTLGDKFKIIIHRDRDSLTEAECSLLRQKYADAGAFLWIPKLSCLEAYFCQPEMISGVLGIPETEADAMLEKAFKNRATEISAKFSAQRIDHNRELYPEGGSPSHDDVREELKNQPLGGASGKAILKELKNLSGGKFSEAAAIAFLSGRTAGDLKSFLDDVLRV